MLNLVSMSRQINVASSLSRLACHIRLIHSWNFGILAIQEAFLIIISKNPNIQKT